MKYEIKNRWTAEVLFSIKTDSLKLAIEAAVKAKADLSSADLRSANLRYADLSSADLSSADLRSANLRYADLSSANLRYANLRYANLRYADLSSADLSSADLSSADLSSADLSSADLRSANLRYANLRYADLSSADLDVIRNDVWSILLFAQSEVPVLRRALIDGKVDGSVYEGECACLCGTLANARKCNYREMKGITPNSLRPAERFFMGIKKGDTPETNPVSKIALEWVDTFLTAIKKTQYLPQHNPISPPNPN